MVTVIAQWAAIVTGLSQWAAIVTVIAHWAAISLLQLSELLYSPLTNCAYVL